MNFCDVIEEIESLTLELEKRHDYACLRLLATFVQYARKENGEELSGDDLRCLVEIRQYLWEKLHSVTWFQTPDVYRSLFGYVVALLVSKTHIAESDALQALDVGILLSVGNSRNLLQSLVDEKVSSMSTHRSEKYVLTDFIPIPTVKMPAPNQYASRIPRIDCIDTVQFYEEFHLKSHPVVITGVATSWPAFDRWRDLNYLLQVAGNRLVPIELGSSYLARDARTSLMPLKEFIDRYILRPQQRETAAAHTAIAYLAQHDLLSQIPVLQKDITIPDYAALLLDIDVDNDLEVTTNVWFGPVNTHSPLHYDCYYNLLAQIVGYKYIRLYAPEYTDQLSPLEGRMKNNSEIDLLAEDVLGQYPSLCTIPYMDCVLAPGDILYIPRHWWHFVQSLDTATAQQWLAENDHRKRNRNSTEQTQTVQTTPADAEGEIQYSFSVNFWWGNRLSREEVQSVTVSTVQGGSSS